MGTYTTKSQFLSMLPPREATANKSSFGRALLICGSDNMPGAAALATLATLRSGAGLVTLASTKSVINTLSSSIFEAMYFDIFDDVMEKSRSMNVVGIGCGMGKGERGREILQNLLQCDGCPLVIDADGLNILSENVAMLKSAKRKIILTPHPLEFSRLSGESVEEILQNREAKAKAFAKEYGITLLLKGKDSIITDGEAVYINPTGNSSLAKGGSGDTLTGIICAFVAQGASMLDATIIGAYLHGLSAERLSKVYSEYGLLASDISAECARILCQIISENDI